MQTNSIRVVTRQLPVGQGGLMTCCFETTYSNREFTFAFDCGSLNRAHLRGGMDLVDVDKLDILFISHLDGDHVNGIDMLAERMPISTVILPQLDTLAILAAVCGGIAQGSLTADFLNFLSDPIEWFHRRGVARVVFVSRQGGDGTTPNDDQPEPRNRIAFEGRISWRIHASEVNIASEEPAKGNIEALTVSADNLLAIELDDQRRAGLYDWILVPYCHTYAPERIKLFLGAVKNVMGVGRADPAHIDYMTILLSILKSPTKREELKACYALLSKDFNQPSLSLFSGPDQPFAWRAASLRDPRHRPMFNVRGNWRVFPTQGQSALGWLTTGDSNLSNSGSRDPWLHRYRTMLAQVGTFVLPHHGSNSSIHSSVFERLQGATTVACASRNRKKHPHPALLNRLMNHPGGVWHVSQDLDSEFRQEVKLTDRS